MTLDDVEDLHPVAVLGEPCCVNPSRTSDVEDRERPLGQEPADDLLRPEQLELCEPVSDASVLVGGVVVLDDLVGNLGHAHRVGGRRGVGSHR